MKKFKVLEHTADLKIRAFGKTKQELFLNAMLAMEKALRPRLTKKPASTQIKIESENLETLLVDFLDEINYQNEINSEIYNEIYFEKFSDNLIKAELFGRKVKRFGLQIKGVTFHNLNIHQRKNGIWEATVVFDI